MSVMGKDETQPAYEPMVVGANRTSKITVFLDNIIGDAHAGRWGGSFRETDVPPAEEIEILSFFEDGRSPDGRYDGALKPCLLEDHGVEKNRISLSFFFSGEGEHTFFLRRKGDKEPFYRFALYSLEEDLLALNPYKGDFHMHSSHSDGTDSPEYVAASCRRIGLDFMALTDHRQMEPSRIALNWNERMGSPMKVFCGEEVHPPDNPVHHIHFGGKGSVNDLFDTDEYRREWPILAKEIEEKDDRLRHIKASTRWVFNKIKQLGGISIYCHPYWRPDHRFYVPRPINDWIIDQDEYDLLEVYGGFHPFELESNALSESLYEELRSRGKAPAPCGVSDAHGCDGELFGWFYTIVFSRGREWEELASSFSRRACLAVSQVPGEFPRLKGNFRLEKYGYFLLREFYPLHDRLCRREGELMLTYLKDEAKLRQELAALKGRVEKLYERLWARSPRT